MHKLHPNRNAPQQQPYHADEETKALIRRAQAGDLAAFNQLVEQTQGVAYSIAYRLLRSEEEAADAVQESFIKAYRWLAAYRGGSFKSWLLRILTNSCYDQLRQQKRRPTTSFEEFPLDTEDMTQLIDPHEGPEVYAERMELRGRIERGIGTLPIEQREVLILADIEGLDRLWSRLTRRSRQLLCMNQMREGLNFGTRRQGHARSVPLTEIRGSVNRCRDFDAAFRPLGPHIRERWTAVAVATQEEAALPAVDLVRINETYFVVDGHHRISVAKMKGVVAVDAHVIEWQSAALCSSC